MDEPSPKIETPQEKIKKKKVAAFRAERTASREAAEQQTSGSPATQSETPLPPEPPIVPPLTLPSDTPPETPQDTPPPPTEPLEPPTPPVEVAETKRSSENFDVEIFPDDVSNPKSPPPRESPQNKSLRYTITPFKAMIPRNAPPLPKPETREQVKKRKSPGTQMQGRVKKGLAVATLGLAGAIGIDTLVKVVKNKPDAPQKIEQEIKPAVKKQKIEERSTQTEQKAVAPETKKAPDPEFWKKNEKIANYVYEDSAISEFEARMALREALVKELNKFNQALINKYDTLIRNGELEYKQAKSLFDLEYYEKKIRFLHELKNKEIKTLNKEAGVWEWIKDIVPGLNSNTERLSKLIDQEIRFYEFEIKIIRERIQKNRQAETSKPSASDPAPALPEPEPLPRPEPPKPEVKKAQAKGKSEAKNLRVKIEQGMKNVDRARDMEKERLAKLAGSGYTERITSDGKKFWVYKFPNSLGSQKINQNGQVEFFSEDGAFERNHTMTPEGIRLLNEKYGLQIDISK